MITRNNYEEYFLLLADNELSAEEAAAVMQFAAQHPDLAEELDILMSCRLEEAPMPVFPKEKLLRPAMWDAENIEPVQTQLLLLLDGELSITEKQQLEKQIAANTILQADWNTLQQTKLAADTVAHPNKELLQHSERKVRPLLWMRWAAAAAMVAGLGWLFQLQQKPESATPSNTYATTTTPRQKVRATAPTTSVVSHQTAIVAVTRPATQPADNIPATSIATNRLHRADNHTNKQQPAPLTASNKLPTAPNSVVKNTPPEAEPIVVRFASTDAELVSNSSHAATPQVAHLSPKAVALPVLATNQKMESFAGKKNESAAEENDYVTIGGAHVNKQKMRGLFRNVTRTVARSFTKSKMEPDVYAVR